SRLDRRYVGIFRTDVGGCQHCDRTIKKIVESDASMERRSFVVVPAAECRIYTRITSGIDIDRWTEMGDCHAARVLERDAEIEDVGVRVKQIIGRIDDLRALQGNVLTDLHVDAAGCEPRQVEKGVSLDDIE